MAKDTVTRFFTEADQVSGLDLFTWVRVPPVNMLGFGGGWTVDRVRLHYQIATEITQDANGTVDSAIQVTLAVTTGNPPLRPAFQPLDPSPGDEVIYREIARMTGPGSIEKIFIPAQGAVDAKSKRSIPPSPGSAAHWFGFQRFHRTGPTTGAAIEFFVTGVLIQLRGAP